jgi:hypothetical protein
VFIGVLVIDKLLEQKMSIELVIEKLLELKMSIEFLVKLGKNVTNIYAVFQQVYGEGTISRVQDLCQVGSFKMEEVAYK